MSCQRCCGRGKPSGRRLVLLAALGAAVYAAASGHARAEPIVETSTPLPEYVWTEIIEADRAKSGVFDQTERQQIQHPHRGSRTPTSPHPSGLYRPADRARISPISERYGSDVRPTPALYRRHGPPAGFSIVVTFFSALAVLLIVVAWRRPSSPPPGVRPPPRRGLVCLTCSRCDRVVDLPADRLGRRLFCPRCGATLSGGA